MAQRIHLDAAEALSVDIGLDFFAADVRALERIEVHERDKTARITGGRLCDTLVSRVILRAEHSLLDFVFIHERDQLLGEPSTPAQLPKSPICACASIFFILPLLSAALEALDQVGGLHDRDHDRGDNDTCNRLHGDGGNGGDCRRRADEHDLDELIADDLADAA